MDNSALFDSHNDALLLFYNINGPSGNGGISVAPPPLPEKFGIIPIYQLDLLFRIVLYPEIPSLEFRITTLTEN
uniref:DUF4183 domain-containing protein n=1 Tax=Heterorhabditis bacteriophora TaxID=37862 RepID=A0A1I7WM72_HETBA